MGTRCWKDTNLNQKYKFLNQYNYIVMKATDTISKIKTLLGMELSKEVKGVGVKTEKVKLATLNLENGTAIEAEEFESGREVFIITEDDRVPMPIGEYTLEDGRSVVVKEEGLIDSIISTTEVEEEVIETSKEDVKAEDLATNYPSKEEFNELKSMVEEMRTNLSEVLGSQKDEIKKLETELSASPAAQPITHSPESKSKEMDFQISANRVETSLDRIIKKISK